MPADVRNALKGVVHNQSGRSEEQAEEYIKDMERTNRYQAETWN